MTQWRISLAMVIASIATPAAALDTGRASVLLAEACRMAVQMPHMPNFIDRLAAMESASAERSDLQEVLDRFIARKARRLAAAQAPLSEEEIAKCVAENAAVKLDILIMDDPKYHQERRAQSE